MAGARWAKSAPYALRSRCSCIIRKHRRVLIATMIVEFENRPRFLSRSLSRSPVRGSTTVRHAAIKGTFYLASFSKHYVVLLALEGNLFESGKSVI